jgi:hypothetical protein
MVMITCWQQGKIAVNASERVGWKYSTRVNYNTMSLAMYNPRVNKNLDYCTGMLIGQQACIFGDSTTYDRQYATLGNSESS